MSPDGGHPAAPGAKRLDKIQVKDIRQWINKLAATCQCCEQGKDAARPEAKRRCCAVQDKTIGRNPVSNVKMTTRRAPKARRKSQAWSVDDARWFLESSWHAGEALYAAFVLVLVLGLRRGVVLGLAWDRIDFDADEL
jgi:integrase